MSTVRPYFVNKLVIVINFVNKLVRVIVIMNNVESSLLMGYKC